MTAAAAGWCSCILHLAAPPIHITPPLGLWR